AETALEHRPANRLRAADDAIDAGTHEGCPVEEADRARIADDSPLQDDPDLTAFHGKKTVRDRVAADEVQNRRPQCVEVPSNDLDPGAIPAAEQHQRHVIDAGVLEALPIRRVGAS